MSRLPIKTKEKAVHLRQQGYSLKEITQALGIAKSTASLWSREIVLSGPAKQRLLRKIKLGQYISAERKKARTKKIKEELLKEAINDLMSTKIKGNYGKLLCAMIYWCEGIKNDSGIGFTNSDPHLTRRFIDLLVKHFGAERSRFKARLHLHGYHNPDRQKTFWKKHLGLSYSSFYKPYLKPNTGKRIRNNYPGCVAISYNNTMLARKVLSFAKAFLLKI